MGVKTKKMIRLAAIWNDTVIAETVAPVNRSISIGSHKSNTLITPEFNGGNDLIGERYELFTAERRGGFTLNSAQGVDGWVEASGERKALQDGLQLDEGEQGTVKLSEEFSVFFRVIDAPVKTKPISFFQSTESRFFGAILGALFFHLSFLVFVLAMQRVDVSLETLDIDERFIDITGEPPPEEEIPEDEDEDTSKAMEGEEGKFGEEDKSEESKVPTNDAPMQDRVQKVALAQALTTLRGVGALSSVFGNRDSFSEQLANSLGGGDASLVIGHGVGGAGLRGGGSGGGGSGFGQIHGMGNVPGRGGRGRARLGRGAQRRRRPRVNRGRPRLGNFCRQADILRVVQQRSRGITFCYERELANNPELQGKVNLAWIIGLNGQVIRAYVAGSTLNNGAVESCMVRSVKRWTFTRPEGGLCQINFPFVFNAGL